MRDINALRIAHEKAQRVFGVSLPASTETLRQAFNSLVKAYHPDTGGTTANVEKFHEVKEKDQKAEVRAPPAAGFLRRK